MEQAVKEVMIQSEQVHKVEREVSFADGKSGSLGKFCNSN